MNLTDRQGLNPVHVTLVGRDARGSSYEEVLQVPYMCPYMCPDMCAKSSSCLPLSFPSPHPPSPSPSLATLSFCLGMCLHTRSHPSQSSTPILTCVCTLQARVRA